MASKRAAYQRRGRAALLGAGAVFVAAQLFAGLLLDWRGLAVRFPSAARVLAAAPRGNYGPDVVLLGSSRFMGVNADMATALLRHEHPEGSAVEVCNAAVPGGDPIAEDYVLEHLLSQGSRPRLAVVEVSPDTVVTNNPMFALHCHRQIVWWNTPAYFVDICRSGELRKLAASRLVPLYAHRRELVHQASLAVAALSTPPPARSAPTDLGLAAGQSIPWDSLLAVSLPPLSPAEADQLKEAAQGQARRFRGYQSGGTTTAALERLLQRCHDNGVEVILVGAPVTSFFREDYTPAVDAAYLPTIERLARTNGCRFIDYRDAVPDQGFGDLVHMNGAGSTSFTCKLTRDVLSPWLSQQEAVETRP